MFLAVALLLTAMAPDACAWSVGDLIYPRDSINANIDRMERAAQDLIRRFGNTVDEATLNALRRLLAGIQSARGAYGDVLGETMERVGEQRVALLNGLAGQVVEVDRALDGSLQRLETIEQRISNTLSEALRSERAPWVLGYGPTLYRTDGSRQVRVFVRGQNLADARNRLVVGGREIQPSGLLPNELTFFVDRALLQPAANGFAQATLRAYRRSTSWLPWAADPAPAEFTLLLRAMGPTVGRYQVHMTVPSQRAFATREVSISLQNPVDKEECINAAQGEEIDIGFVQAAATLNLVHTAAHNETVEVLRGMPLQFPVPAATRPGPSPPFRAGYTAPERICFFISSPPPPYSHTEVTLKVTYRARLQNPPEVAALLEGEIPWGQDTAVALPQANRFSRASVTFTGSMPAAVRTFTGPERHGPVEFKMSADSRTLTFRPQDIE